MGGGAWPPPPSLPRRESIEWKRRPRPRLPGGGTGGKRLRPQRNLEFADTIQDIGGAWGVEERLLGVGDRMDPMSLWEALRSSMVARREDQKPVAQISRFPDADLSVVKFSLSSSIESSRSESGDERGNSLAVLLCSAGIGAPLRADGVLSDRGALSMRKGAHALHHLEANISGSAHATPGDVDSSVASIGSSSLRRDVGPTDQNLQSEGEGKESRVVCWILDLEEAFYLAFDVGCLSIARPCVVQGVAAEDGPLAHPIESTFLSCVECWDKFCEIRAREQGQGRRDGGTHPALDLFAQSMAAYAWTKNGGWVVRPGYNFGSKYMLYAHRPDVVHASFCLVIFRDLRLGHGTEREPRAEDDVEEDKGEGFKWGEEGAWAFGRTGTSGWLQVQSLSRVANQARKAALIVYASPPLKALSAKASPPRSFLPHHAVRLRAGILHRWEVGRGRE